MEKVHLDAVLKDMYENRDILVHNLARLNDAIGCLERMYNQPALVAVPATAVQTVDAHPSSHARYEYPDLDGVRKKNKTNAETEPELETPVRRVALDTCMALVEAIHIAAGEGKHTQAEMTHRVIALRPGTTVVTAANQVSQMLKNSRLHKGDDGIVRNVKDGKIQNLPPLGKEELSGGSHRFGQYDKH